MIKTRDLHIYNPDKEDQNLEKVMSTKRLFQNFEKSNIDATKKFISQDYSLMFAGTNDKNVFSFGSSQFIKMSIKIIFFLILYIAKV